MAAVMAAAGAGVFTLALRLSGMSGRNAMLAWAGMLLMVEGLIWSRPN